MTKTLYITDLDGTLLRGDETVSPVSTSILNEMLDKGLFFSVCTARSVVTASRILKGLHLRLPIITMNGVFACDAKTGKALRSQPLAQDTAGRLLSVFLAHGRPPFLFTFDGNDLRVQYQALKSPQEEAFVKDRKTKYKSFRQVPAFQFGDDCVYMSALDTRQAVEAVYADAFRIPGVQCSKYADTYTDLWFLECFSDRASKAEGALWLKEKTGADQMVAFGDNLNDLGMLEAADIAVAVSNARPEVLRAADVTAGSHEKDGVARMIWEMETKIY